MRLDELPTSDRIEDRRGLPGGRAGLGIGTVVILGLIGWALGIDPRVLIGGAEMMSQNGQTQQQADAGRTGPTGAPSDEMGHFVSAILGSTEAEWTEIFAGAGKTYRPPTLVLFAGATQSGCGFAKAAMGPFYCPIDQKVYLDTSFFQDLERRGPLQDREAECARAASCRATVLRSLSRRSAPASATRRSWTCRSVA